MIDLHSHLLFGIDDGAGNENTTRRMLEAYAGQGVSTVAATSHSAVLTADYQNAFEIVSKWSAECGIALLPGREYTLSDAVERKSSLQLLGKSNVMLLDLGFFSVNTALGNCLDDFSQTLLFAHPERLWKSSPLKNAAFLRDRRECFFQLNSGSFLGKYGKSAERAAWQLLDRGFCSAIASDAHSDRGIDLADCRKLLSSYYPAEMTDLLFEVNPRRILKGERPLPVFPPTSFSMRIRQFFHPFLNWRHK